MPPNTSTTTTTTSSAAMSTCPTTASATRLTYTVYLIRHGEALHNVEEKRVRAQVLAEATAEGLSPDDPQVQQRIDQARKEILTNQAFFDAPLTAGGEKEALRARERIDQWVSEEEEEALPVPEEVLVSPLRRALRTAELIFPNRHIVIHARECLRERLTGRPADNHLSSVTLARRFSRFDFQELRNQSTENFKWLFSEKDAARTTEGEATTMPPVADLAREASSLNTDSQVEDEAKLQSRTMQLFQLLSEYESGTAVAVITHKGFLRGLERGCLGQPDAPEFTNCEVRVYRITFASGNNFLDSIERLR